jgi:outer membrane protein assembly factor BamB
LEHLVGGITSYTIIINLSTQEEISFDIDKNFWFWDFFSIENNFILASFEKAYSFNDMSGELLWTQEYKQQYGKGHPVVNHDHFIINDFDGNIYRIYADGRKVKENIVVETMINDLINNDEISNSINIYDDLNSFIPNENTVTKTKYYLIFIVIFIAIVLIIFLYINRSRSVN